MSSKARARYRRTAFDHARVTSTDRTTSPILDTTEAIDIVQINHPELPSAGAGESSIRPRTAALANAIFDTSGVRLRRAALTRERVEPALRRRPCAHTSGADYRTKPEGGTGCDQSPAIGGSRTRGGCRGAWSQHPQAGRKPRGIRASRSCGGSVGLDRRHEGGRPISLAVPRKRSAGHSPPEGHDVRRADGAHLLCDGSGLWGHLLGRLQALEAQTKLERTAASTSRPTRR